VIVAVWWEAAMTRVVRGADGRMWTVKSRLEWTDPASEEHYEHDIGGGRVGALILLVVLVVLSAVFVLLTPPNVVFPSWLALAFVLLILFFPIRWLVRRPWTLVAETPGGGINGLPPERWVGQVRGYFNTRHEAARASRHLREYASPDRDGDGPLQPVS
jgi:hypothetical protein